MPLASIPKAFPEPNRHYNGNESGDDERKREEFEDEWVGSNSEDNLTADNRLVPMI